MSARSLKCLLTITLGGGLWVCRPAPCLATTAEPLPLPKGVQVLARGPVHEAFATPVGEPKPTKPVPKKPPKPINELPPEQKPEGNVIWIPGYWAWDDERHDFLWVSGIWRTPPPGKQWVPGYWRQVGAAWQWVPGFWTDAVPPEDPTQDMTYLPAPPPLPTVAPPGDPPDPDSFYVPGYWVWRGDNYVWRAGYWARIQPGYTWIPAHYLWTFSGYVFIPGYWDLAVAERGVLYAPVVVDPLVVGPAFVYTPSFLVMDGFFLDTLFVGPFCCHYYFGDYYGPYYCHLGFQSCFAYYSRCPYDPIIGYAYWEHHYDPHWIGEQVNLYTARSAGLAPVPPRTLMQQNIANVTNIRGTNFRAGARGRAGFGGQALAPASQLAAAKGIRTVPVNAADRREAQQHGQALRQAGLERRQVEVGESARSLEQPRMARFTLPASKTSSWPQATAQNGGGTFSQRASSFGYRSPSSYSYHSPMASHPYPAASGMRSPWITSEPFAGRSAFSSSMPRSFMDMTHRSSMMPGSMFRPQGGSWFSRPSGQSWHFSGGGFSSHASGGSHAGHGR